MLNVFSKWHRNCKGYKNIDQFCHIKYIVKLGDFHHHKKGESQQIGTVYFLISQAFLVGVADSCFREQHSRMVKRKYFRTSNRSSCSKPASGGCWTFLYLGFSLLWSRGNNRTHLYNYCRNDLNLITCKYSLYICRIWNESSNEGSHTVFLSN